MKKTSFAITTLLASLSLACVVPASYAAENNNEAKASSFQPCKQCTCDGKCHDCDLCNKKSDKKKNHQNCDTYKEK